MKGTKGRDGMSAEYRTTPLLTAIRKHAVWTGLGYGLVNPPKPKTDAQNPSPMGYRFTPVKALEEAYKMRASKAGPTGPEATTKIKQDNVANYTPRIRGQVK